MSYLNIHEHKFDFRALVEKKSELLVKYSVNNWFVLCSNEYKLNVVFHISISQLYRCEL